MPIGRLSTECCLRPSARLSKSNMPNCKSWANGWSRSTIQFERSGDHDSLEELAMPGFRRLATAVLVALAMPACATMNVSSHIEHGAEFTHYRTWDWGPADALPTGDPRLDNNPFFQDHLLGAVEKQM